MGIVRSVRFAVGLAILLAIEVPNALATENKSGTGDSQDVVLVNNARVAVTRADFDAEMERVPEQSRFEFLTSRERIGKLLEEILLRKTLANEAHVAGLDREPQIQKKMEAAKERVLATERILHLTQEAKIPDFDMRARELYRLNPEKYSTKSMVQASHVLVSFTDRSKEEALKRAQEVYALALNGSDFGELAAKYSDDKGSKDNQGDLGYFSADKMVPPFSATAFKMKQGEISEPVETQFGYHIIKVIDVKPGARQEYALVKTQIVDELKSQYLAEFKNAHINQIRGDKDLKINEEEIMKIKTTLPTDKLKQ